LLNDTLNILATAIFMQLFKLLISQTRGSNDSIAYNRTGKQQLRSNSMEGAEGHTFCSDVHATSAALNPNPNPNCMRLSIVIIRVVTSAKKVMFLPVFVCLSVCEQDNSKSYGPIFLKF